MGKIIAVFNQKGGVGKTTSVLNLATALSYKGKKVLICDIDPQGNASSGLGLDKDSIDKSIYDVIIEETDPKEVILTTGYKNLHLLPANMNLAGSEVELTTTNNRETKLRHGLEGIKDIYDYILIDCPPSLGLLTINALAASDSVLIPIQCEYYALEGVSQLLNTIDLVKKGINPKIYLEGVLLTMDDKRTKLSSQVIDEVRGFFQELVYDTTIPRNVRLAEAPSFGKTIFDYSFNSSGAKAYSNFAEEFEKRQDD